MLKIRSTLLILTSTILIVSCSKDNNTHVQSQSQSNENKAIEKVAEKIEPEDDPTLKGTPVLGFKLRDSTFDSVKKRLNNYKINGESYAGGPVLENDGSGFDIDGLLFTQFGFDKNQKLVYVWMTLSENNHMSKETYKKIVSYVQKNNYKIIREKAPFVGDQETVFLTPNNEMITVSAPHMGGFKVNIEYVTQEFEQQRTQIIQESQQKKNQSEAANF